MSSKSKISLMILGAISLITIIVLIQKNITAQKANTSLTSKVAELEEELKKSKQTIGNLKAAISELEEDLSEVKHFDNYGNVQSGFSSGSRGTVSFTGDVLETQIDGEFEGWDGDTIFKMMNGTIWQQVSYDYTYHYAYMPSVIIYRKRGMFYMRVEGVDDEIAVRQIK